VWESGEGAQFPSVQFVKRSQLGSYGGAGTCGRVDKWVGLSGAGQAVVRRAFVPVNIAVQRGTVQVTYIVVWADGFKRFP